MSERQIDPAALDRLVRIGGEKLKDQIITIFLQDAPARITTALDAAENLQWDKVADSAHSLKSSSGNVGAMAMSKLTNEIELNIRTGQLQTVPAQISVLKTVFDEVVQELKDIYTEGKHE